jgi:hypothetical protein
VRCSERRDPPTDRVASRARPDRARIARGRRGAPPGRLGGHAPRRALAPARRSRRIGERRTGCRAASPRRASRAPGRPRAGGNRPDRGHAGHMEENGVHKPPNSQRAAQHGRAPGPRNLGDRVQPGRVSISRLALIAGNTVVFRRPRRRRPGRTLGEIVHRRSAGRRFNLCTAGRHGAPRGGGGRPPSPLGRLEGSRGAPGRPDAGPAPRWAKNPRSSLRKRDWTPRPRVGGAPPSARAEVQRVLAGDRRGPGGVRAVRRAEGASPPRTWGTALGVRVTPARGVFVRGDRRGAVVRPGRGRGAPRRTRGRRRQALRPAGALQRDRAAVSRDRPRGRVMERERGEPQPPRRPRTEADSRQAPREPSTVYPEAHRPLKRRQREKGRFLGIRRVVYVNRRAVRPRRPGRAPDVLRWKSVDRPARAGWAPGTAAVHARAEPDNRGVSFAGGPEAST